jgi:hypothetical protein
MCSGDAKNTSLAFDPLLNSWDFLCSGYSRFISFAGLDDASKCAVSTGDSQQGLVTDIPETGGTLESVIARDQYSPGESFDDLSQPQAARWMEKTSFLT